MILVDTYPNITIVAQLAEYLSNNFEEEKYLILKVQEAYEECKLLEGDWVWERLDWISCLLFKPKIRYGFRKVPKDLIIRSLHPT